MLSIELIDIASFVFIFCVIFVCHKISKRINKPLIKIILGVEKNAFIKLSTLKEKSLILLAITCFFFFYYLHIHGIKTICDISLVKLQSLYKYE